MTDKLEMPLEKFAEAVAKENVRLVSGPGGIMEMKQTIADKERRIEKLETALRYYAKEYENPFGGNDSLIAREALEWTENYGQGSEPWLKEVDNDE